MADNLTNYELNIGKLREKLEQSRAETRRALERQNAERLTTLWRRDIPTTVSPEEALEWVKAGNSFDIVILDLHIPEMDGVQLAGALRQVKNQPTLPLILFTSLSTRELGEAANLFAGILQKPLKPSSLYDNLLNILGKSALSQSPKLPL